MNYMEFKIVKRFFTRGTSSVKKNISITPEMDNAFERLAEVTGEEVPDIMRRVFDEFLVQMVQQGLIDAPKGVEIKMGESVALKSVSGSK